MFTDTLELSAYPGIRLRDWDQWRMWIAYVKSIAQIYSVWHLVDPSKSEDEVAEKLIQMPILDEPPQELLDDKLTMDPIVWERKYTLYRIHMKVHKARYKEWEVQHTGIMAVHAYILKHLDRRLITQLANDDLFTPHAMLTHLNKRFGRTRAGDLQVLYKWEQMKLVPLPRAPTCQSGLINGTAYAVKLLRQA
ncbi:hypothetical protein N7528_002449 [Penicillium herquei]|nr:hypothetical protein N7528_002449 [Penicillium herquei]